MGRQGCPRRTTRIRQDIPAREVYHYVALKEGLSVDPDFKKERLKASRYVPTVRVELGRQVGYSIRFEDMDMTPRS